MQAQNFSRFAFSQHFKGPAANLAICGKPLCRHTGVDRQRESLTADGAKNDFRNFHVAFSLKFPWIRHKIQLALVKALSRGRPRDNPGEVFGDSPTCIWTYAVALFMRLLHDRGGKEQVGRSVLRSVEFYEPFSCQQCF